MRNLLFILMICSTYSCFGHINENIWFSKGFLSDNSNNFFSVESKNTFQTFDKGLNNKTYNLSYRKNKPLSDSAYLIWDPIPIGFGVICNNSLLNKCLSEIKLGSTYSKTTQFALGPQFNNGLFWKSKDTFWVLNLNYLLAHSLSNDLYFWEVFFRFGPSFVLNDSTHLTFNLTPKYTSVFKNIFPKEETIDSTLRYLNLLTSASVDLFYGNFIFQPQYSLSVFSQLIRDTATQSLTISPATFEHIGSLKISTYF